MKKPTFNICLLLICSCSNLKFFHWIFPHDYTNLSLIFLAVIFKFPSIAINIHLAVLFQELVSTIFQTFEISNSYPKKKKKKKKTTHTSDKINLSYQKEIRKLPAIVNNDLVFLFILTYSKIYMSGVLITVQYYNYYYHIHCFTWSDISILAEGNSICLLLNAVIKLL